MEKLIQRNSFKNSICVLCVLFTSLLVRLEYRNAFVIENPVMGDAYYYMSYGYNIVKHKVFAKEPTFNSDKVPKPDAFWAPGFPFMLSSAIRIGSLSGDGFYPIATLYNAILGACMAPMIFYICLQFMPLGYSLSAALMTAISPHLLSVGGYLLTETLFGFLLISSMFFFVMGVKNNKTLYYLISGLLIGLAYLTNPIILFSPLL